MTPRDRFRRILDRLLAAVRAHYGARLVTLAVFGSVGRGTPRDDSDVDLLIVGRSLPDGRWNRVDEFLPVERALTREWTASGEGPVTLSPVFKTPEEVRHGSPLFYGDVDFIPTEQYSAAQAAEAYEEAAWVLALAEDAISPLST